ncbi:hypothetical protein G9C85_06515 [Halorubellus sp. JP-L1]|uniref:hypothetical protein n=1 Tax=Halorubellus sp. JP-L1 TaxID=2715753 RepID=UPI00140E7812|nr:hypothetical protein [Halorubellus sp. JP-L1]NHN41289.1 hypothetical protein [Halorubellus sp. JP-L1]
MPSDDDRDATGRDGDATGDRGTHTVELDARVYEHVQAMGMPDESASDTLARLLGLTPDPATVAGDELSSPLPEDPAVPDSLAGDPTADAAAVDPSEVPDPEPAPADVDASLGELATVLHDDERDRMEALLAEIAAADPEQLEGIVDALEDEDDAGERSDRS